MTKTPSKQPKSKLGRSRLTEIFAQLTAFNKKLDSFTKRLDELERQTFLKDTNTPLIGSPNFPLPVTPLDIDKCAVCGGFYKDMGNYVCPNSACPSRIHVTCDPATAPKPIGDFPHVTFGDCPPPSFTS